VVDSGEQRFIQVFLCFIKSINSLADWSSEQAINLQNVSAGSDFTRNARVIFLLLGRHFTGNAVELTQQLDSFF